MIDLDAIKKRLATQTNAIFDYGEIAALVAEVEMHRKLRGADCMYINQLCKERDQLKAENEYIREWYATRWKRLRDLLKEHPAIDSSACAIMANGTASPEEPPTYALQLNVLKHERDSALAKLQTCREALDNAQDVLRILYHTTEGRAAEKAHECTRKIDKALEASK